MNKPYEVVENQIFNENCLETLSKLKDNSVDLVITSPPYNMNLRIRNGKYCSRQIVKEFSTKYDEFEDNLPIEDFYNFHLKVLKELISISPIVFYNISIVTGSKRAFFKIIGELNEYLKEIIVWDKGTSQPAMQFNVLNRQSELILVFEKANAISRQFQKANFERGTLSDVWQIKKGKKDKEIVGHSAVFPEELVNKILLNFSNENNLVYDPFLGTGTTAVACKKLNRRFLGSEISEKYIEIAQKRLNSATSMLSS